MHGTRKSAGLVLALALAGLSCVDPVDRRTEWMRRLVVLGEYSRALDVHAELEALGCLKCKPLTQGVLVLPRCVLGRALVLFWRKTNDKQVH